MQDGANQKGVTGLFPMIATFQRSFGIDQNVGDILDVAHLPFTAANFQQRIVGGRLCIGRIEQQDAAMPATKARGQGPVLALDVVDDAAARPGQQRRHDQTDTLAGPGRSEAQHVFRPIVTQIVALELAEDDTVWCGQTGGTNLLTCRPAGRAIGRGNLGLTCPPHRHADRGGDRDKATGGRDIRALDKDIRRIGVVRVPPPEERGRQINRNAGSYFEPGLPQLRLITELPGDPLRGRPSRGEHDP